MIIIFKFEIRNKKRLGGYLLFGLVMIVLLFAHAGSLSFGVNYLSNMLVGKYNNALIWGTVVAILLLMLIMQMGRTDEFSSVETGIKEYKERGMLAYVSRTTLVLLLILFLLCLCC